MRGLVVALLFAFAFQSSASAGSPSNDEKLYRSIGKVIAVEDSRLNSGALSPLAIGVPGGAILDEEYKKNIQGLPVKKRVAFFWSVMMHTLMDGEAYHDFVILVSKDCRTEFMKTLDKFMVESKSVGRSNWQVDRVASVYGDLAEIESNKNGK